MYNLGNAEKNKLGLKENENKYDSGEYHVDINSENDSHSILAREILKSTKKEIKILDIGCGCGVMGEFFSENKNIILDGIEIDEEAIAVLKKKKQYRNVYSFSIEDLHTKEHQNKLDTYDFIIMGDLLEHLIHPYETIENLEKFMKPDGNILISLPNIAHIDIIKNLLNDKFNYNYTGTLDTTHLRFYTLKSFAEMIDNLNQHRNKKIDLELIGSTHTYPENIDYSSELFQTLDETEHTTILQFIFKLSFLKESEEAINLKHLLNVKELKIYNKIEEQIENSNGLLEDNKKLFEENTELMTANSYLVDELNHFQKENNSLKAVALNMLNSTSWKLTAPVRKSGVVISKVKNKVSRVNAKIKLGMDKTGPTNLEEIKIELTSERPDVAELVNILKDYDIISFDIFDTLIFRPFVKPTDLFQIIGIENKLQSFAKNRVEAEQRARENTTKANYEINIDDIYNELQEYYNEDIEKLKKIEFEAEKKYCYANPFMKKVYDELLKLNKTIIITSDMYWPRKDLQKLLTACGYKDYENLFVSCDYELNKGNGKIQKKINTIYPKKKIAHIGDNFKSDIEGSQKADWAVYHYKSCKEIAEYLNDPVYDDSLVNSITSAIRYNYLYSGDQKFSKYYKYGFKYGGILVCGYLDYINELAEKKNIDKILFLARDAKIFSDVYNRFYKKYKNEYVLISRSAMFEADFENNMHSFFNFYFQYRANVGKMTIEESLKETDLDILLPLLSQYNLTAAEYLTNENIHQLKKLIYENKETIENYFAPSKKAALDYFKSVTKDAKNVLTVDLGWGGTILFLLRSFFEKNGVDVNVSAAFLGNKDSNEVNSMIDLGIFHSYCFCYNKNKDLDINIESWEGSTQAMIMESMFTSNAPTLLKYAPNENIYGNITNNKKILEEIHQGIMDFAEIYTDWNKKFGNNLKLNSYSAFKPLRKVLNNHSYNYEIFKEFKEFQDSLPRFGTEKEITTVGKIMKNRNFI